MKKQRTLLLLIAMLFMGNVFSQSWSEWSQWSSVSCFKGIDFRVKTKQTSYDRTKYEVKVEYRNRYQETINFDYEVSASNSYPTTGRVSVKGNSGTYSSWVGGSFISDNIQVEVSRLRFGSDDLKPYSDCDKY